jgi:hypothetical protein
MEIQPDGSLLLKDIWLGFSNRKTHEPPQKACGHHFVHHGAN